MSNIVPFTFENHNIRVVTDEHGNPLFVGKDICDALGYKNHNDAMNDHCRGVAKRYPIADSLGRMQETRVIEEPDMMRLVVNSQLPTAQAFERLVFEEILPTIRKTGSYSVKEAKTTAINAAKEFRSLYGIARLIGLDRNVASIKANQAALKLTGTDVLKLLDSTHLDNAEQIQYFTPTELGKMFGDVSARKLNMLLAEAGLQAKVGDVWVPSESGNKFCRVLDTSKKHNDGAMVQQVKWAKSVLKELTVVEAQ